MQYNIAELVIALIPLLYFCNFLLRQKVGCFAIAIFILAAVVSLHYLNVSNNMTNTNDSFGHWGYTQFIMHNWLDPYGYKGWQHHHPPLYYYSAALFVWMSSWFGIPSLTAVRLLSWICYLAFNVFSLLTLRRASLSGISYYASVTLLLLWPAGFHLASKISNEPMFYAFSAASFYYLVTWYQKRAQYHLMRALMIAGVAFTVRTGAITLLAVIGTIVLISFLRGRLDLRAFITKEWGMVGIFLCCCLAINMGQVIFYNVPLNDHFGVLYAGKAPFPLWHYLTLHFDYTLAHPFNDWSSNQSFWDYLCKTALFGEYVWPSPQLAVVMHFFLLLIILYALLPWLFATRVQWRGMLPYVLNLLVPLVFLIDFFIRMRSLVGQDARYIYPSLSCFVVLFGKSHAFSMQRGAFVLSWLGLILVAGFTLLSTYYFWTNVR